MGTFAEQLESYVGQPVAVLCMRYWYRGILSVVGEDFIVLDDSKAVETTGRASNETVEVEDPIPGQLLLKTMAVEIVCQPNWVWDGYDIKRPS